MGKSLKILEDPEILTRHLRKSEAFTSGKRLQPVSVYSLLKMAHRNTVVDLKVVIFPCVFF